MLVGRQVGGDELRVVAPQEAHHEAHAHQIGEGPICLWIIGGAWDRMG